MSESILELDRVTRRFGATTALNAVSLACAPGSVRPAASRVRRPLPARPDAAAAEAAAAARAEGYGLTIDEYNDLIKQGGTEADLTTKVREYAEPLYNNQEDAKQALIDAGFSEADATKYTFAAYGKPENLSKTISDYTFDASEVKAIAAAEGVTLTDEEAAEIAEGAGVGRGYDLEKKIRPSLMVTSCLKNTAAFPVIKARRLEATCFRCLA